MKLTMKSIAEKLGVSRTTVSLVLKGDGDKYRISKDTQRKILNKVNATRFRPDFFATSLKKKATRQIGLIIPDVFETFMGKVVRGIEDALFDRDYTLLLSTCRFDGKREAKIIDQLLHRRVDGLLIVPNAPFRNQEYSYQHLHNLANSQTPFVFIDRTVPGISAASVVQDDFAGTYEAVSRLIRMGRRMFSLITFDLTASSIAGRCRGFEQALHDNGIQFDSKNAVYLDKKDPSAMDLSEKVKMLMSGSSRPDAFFVTTEGLAFKSFKLLHDYGFFLNQDYAMARFGDAPDNHPGGMICVLPPHIEMGHNAANLLLEMISSQDKFPGKPQKIILKPFIHDPVEKGLQ